MKKFVLSEGDFAVVSNFNQRRPKDAEEENNKAKEEDNKAVIAWNFPKHAKKEYNKALLA